MKQLLSKENLKMNQPTTAFLENYYYSKGALDYRDKLLSALSEMESTEALRAFEYVMAIHPDLPDTPKGGFTEWD